MDMMFRSYVNCVLVAIWGKEHNSRLAVHSVPFLWFCMFNLILCSIFSVSRYEKYKKGQTSENEERIPLSSNGDPKYVIIDEFESLDNELESWS